MFSHQDQATETLEVGQRVLNDRHLPTQSVAMQRYFTFKLNTIDIRYNTARSHH